MTIVTNSYNFNNCHNSSTNNARKMLMREKFIKLALHLQDLNEIKNAFVEKYEEMKSLVETVLECGYEHDDEDETVSNFVNDEEEEKLIKEEFVNFLDLNEFLLPSQQEVVEQESHTGLFDSQSIPKSLSSMSLFRCASSESLLTSQQLLNDSVMMQQIASPEHESTSSGSALLPLNVLSVVGQPSDLISQNLVKSTNNVKRHKRANKSHKRKKLIEKEDSSKKIKMEESIVQTSIDNFATLLTKENPITCQSPKQTVYGEFNWINSFGSFGSADGQFDGPVDIKYLSRRDYLLVACYNNKNIQIFDAKTLEYKYQISTQSEIRGMALDPTNDNSILISCDDSIVSRYTIMESWHVEMYGSKGCKSNQFNGPTGMVVDEEGRIFVCDCLNSRIVVLSKEGQFLYNFGEKGTKKGQFLMPWSITIDSFGNLLITDSGRHVIQVYSPNGEHLNEIGKKGSSKFEFNTPRAITIDQITGNVLICDEGNNRIQIFNSTLTEHVKIIEDRLHAPTGLTLDPTRALLYVSEWDLEHNFIQIFK
ncbi:predicted protein [Naegleria gruberi]|uniref:Predicted protein n=1 Tax=Naegleria gruberi TaxID=5762 RepID=D2W382_NAEGR|nr:uncharacterized protein NAEGRDRAFT_75852 [Naegleria gruberi]EFC36445.1 predicted protein [Naegleria gruberi]|eukprot:XP_002669189.1 predicted protein [Naegleria gruberi strain NEG-M]